jgi:hypothetical protein
MGCSCPTFREEPLARSVSASDRWNFRRARELGEAEPS